MSGGRLECRIYIGNLPPYARTKDLDDIFYKYGKINFIDIKNNNNRGSPYGFVEFDDPRDAEDAVKARDGYHFDGYKLRVEFCKGGKGNRNDRDDYRSRRRRSGPSSRRSDYRVTVTGLPASGSWQDLKDHMREAGEVYYADVFKNGTGVVEFSRYEDMKYALRKLDDSKFRSHEGETSYIRVRPDPRNGRTDSRSRSPSDKSRGTPNYSPANSRSRS